MFYFIPACWKRLNRRRGGKRESRLLLQSQDLWSEFWITGVLKLKLHILRQRSIKCSENLKKKCWLISRDCMKGDEMENKKIGGSVNLMVRHFQTHLGLFWSRNLNFFLFCWNQNFYKSEVNKEDMYIRYIHKLCDLHLQAEDFTGNRKMGDSFFLLSCRASSSK